MKQYRLIFCSVCFIYLCRIVAIQGLFGEIKDTFKKAANGADDFLSEAGVPDISEIGDGIVKAVDKLPDVIKELPKTASSVVTGVADILPIGDSSNDAKTEVAECVSKISKDLYSQKSNSAKTCQVRSEYLKCYKQVYGSKLTKEMLAKLKGRIDSLLEKDGFKSCAVHENLKKAAASGGAESSRSLFIVALTAVVQCVVYLAL